MSGAGSLLALLLMWGGALGLGLWRGGFSSWFLFYSLTGVLMYALLVLWCGLRRVEVSRELSAERFRAGDDVLVTVSVRQRSFVPIAWMVVRDEWIREPGHTACAHRKLLFPGFRSSFTYRYAIRGIERGRYRFGEVEISAGDVFGFATRRRKIRCGQSVVVVPRALNVSAEPLALGGAHGSGDVGKLPAAYVSQIGGIRDYADGDPLNRIHWKSSARSGSLKTKLMAPPAASDIFVVLDGGGAPRLSAMEDDRAFETCVEVAAGLAKFAFRQRTGFGFLYRGSDPAAIPFTFQPPPLDKVLELLAAVGPGTRAAAGAAHGSAGGGGSAAGRAPGGAVPGDDGRDATGGSPVAAGGGTTGGGAGNADGVSTHGTQRLPLSLLSLPRQVSVIWITPRLDEESVGPLRALREQGRSVAVLLVRGDSVARWHERQLRRRLETLGCVFAVIDGGPKSGKPKAGVEDVGA